MDGPDDALYRQTISVKSIPDFSRKVNANFPLDEF